MIRSRVLLITNEAGASTTMSSLEAQDYIVEQCQGGIDAMLAVPRFGPDLILIDSRKDSRTDRGHALQLCRSLRAIPANAGIPVVLMGEPDQALSLEALEAGADDYLAQPLTTRESVLRLRAAQRRSDQSAAPQIRRYERIELDLDTYKVHRNGKRVAISAMQFRLLRYLMEHPSTVFSRQQLLESVWHNHALDEGAVTACIVRLRRALNSVGGPNLIRNVPGNGYSLDLDDLENGELPAIAPAAESVGQQSAARDALL